MAFVRAPIKQTVARKEITMRTASAILNELAVHVRPPRGREIYLKLSEQPGRNRTAGCSNMETQKSDRYTVKLVELLKTDPIVDWTGQHRVIWSSEDDSLLAFLA